MLVEQRKTVRLLSKVEKRNWLKKRTAYVGGKETDMTSDHSTLAEDRLAYSIAEASQLTGLGRTTLYKMMDRGELQTRKIGRRRLISAQELLGLVNGNDEKSPLAQNTTGGRQPCT